MKINTVKINSLFIMKIFSVKINSVFFCTRFADFLMIFFSRVLIYKESGLWFREGKGVVFG